VESTWQVYTILLILFHRRMIFKLLALEWMAEKWRFSAGGGPRPTAPSPLATEYGPAPKQLETSLNYDNSHVSRKSKLLNTTVVSDFGHETDVAKYMHV